MHGVQLIPHNFTFAIGQKDTNTKLNQMFIDEDLAKR